MCAVDQQCASQPAIGDGQPVERQPDPANQCGGLVSHSGQRGAGRDDRIERPCGAICFQILHGVQQVGERAEGLTDIPETLLVLRSAGQDRGRGEDPAGGPRRRGVAVSTESPRRTWLSTSP